MSDSDLSQLRVFALRNKLKEAGLSSSGTKQDLIARLSEFYRQQNNELTESQPEYSESAQRWDFVKATKFRSRSRSRESYSFSKASRGEYGRGSFFY